MAKYYRYRGASEIFFKELLYGEIYFSSANESNDPCEGGFKYKFDSGEEGVIAQLREIYKYFERQSRSRERLAAVAKGSRSGDNERPNFEAIYAFFKSNPEHYSLDGILGAFKDWGQKKGVDKSTENFFNYLVGLLPAISSYVYFASFSKNNSDMLMWSHYASGHRGYCLEFEVKNNILARQNACFPAGIGPGGRGGDLKFEEMVYGQVEPLPAINCLVERFCGSNSDSQSQGVKESLKKIGCSKNMCWGYEKEFRLLLLPNKGENEGIPSVDRLLHYDQSQLVGIIFGCRVSKEDRKVVRDIVAKVKRGNEKFNPAYYQAQLSSDNSEMKIVNLKGF